MKLKVKIDNQFFEVEVDNLRERPIIAFVDGDPFEVWPEERPSQTEKMIAPTGQASSSAVNSIQTNSGSEISRAESVLKRQAPVSGALKSVRAPIPGVITQMNVQQGDPVNVGQQLCVLEAMKMNNSIRASRAGRVGMIHVSVGQHVKHNDILIEYSE